MCVDAQQQQEMRTITYEKHVGAKRVKRFTATPERAEQIDNLLQQLAEPVTEHGNARQVLIVGPVNEEVYCERMRRHGAIEITSMCFPSARAASEHFGYDYSAVAQALSRAEREGQPFAVVGGVPVQWADKVGGVN
jgi:hypothetical protein